MPASRIRAAKPKITYLHAAEGGKGSAGTLAALPFPPSVPVVIVPSHPLRLGALLTAGLALTLAACDSSAPLERRANDGALVQTARSWFDQNTAPLGKTGADEALRQFFPDWAGGAVVEGPSGERAVVTRLWSNATATYDSTLYFLRVLAVVVNDSGAVTKGRIVEFASPDSIGEGDGPSLVRSWLRGDYGTRTVFVAEHTAGYEFVEGAGYGPNRAPVPLRVTTERCEVDGAGKTMATTMWCKPWELIESYTTCVPVDTGWHCRTHERWTMLCRVSGSDDTSGGSGTGDYPSGGTSGGGTNGDPGYHQITRPPDMIDLVRAIVNEVQRGSRFDDPAMWRRLLGALSPQAGQCVDALGSLGGSLDATEVSAIVNCASTYLTGSSGGTPIDGTDIVDMLATVPGGLEWAARSASDTALYPWLIQSARDNSDRLRTVALNGRGLDALHALGLLDDTSEGITHNYNVYVLSAMEALRTLGTVSNNRVTFVGHGGQTYTAQAYMSSTLSGNKPTIQISPCPGYLGLNCSDGYKYVVRFPSFDTVHLP